MQHTLLVSGVWGKDAAYIKLGSQFWFGIAGILCFWEGHVLHHFAFMQAYISTCFHKWKEFQRGFLLLVKKGESENSL